MEEACRPGERKCPDSGSCTPAPTAKIKVSAPTRVRGIPLVSVKGPRSAEERMPNTSVAGVRRESFLCPFAKSLTPARVSSSSQCRRSIGEWRPAPPAVSPYVPPVSTPVATARPRTASGQYGPGRPGWDHLPPSGNMFPDIVCHSTWLGCRFGRPSRRQETLYLAPRSRV